MNTDRRYVLISPCRDEANHMRRTLDSVAAQTIPPALWVVVDDGSTDASASILQEYARKLPYLRVVTRPDRGRRSVGPGVVDAFYAGRETVDLDGFEYLCKLDLDLVLPPRYFELIMARMEANPRLGTASGKPYFHSRSGALRPEDIGDDMSVGASKFYRTRCFRDIGGFVRQVMWDGIDCHRCRMLGWMAESVDQEDLRFVHLRPMGSSQKGGLWAGRVRGGFGHYFMGTGPVFVLASAVYRLFSPPRVSGSLAILWGYFSSLARGLARYEDPVFRRFLRRYQRDCLLHGKKAAVRRSHDAQAPVWQAAHARGAEAREGSGSRRSA